MTYNSATKNRKKKIKAPTSKRQKRNGGNEKKKVSFAKRTEERNQKYSERDKRDGRGWKRRNG